jgi:ribonuclease HII
MPDYSIESQHKGRVAGVDEAGRGPLAGPVVAAAVVFRNGVPKRLAIMLDDSKKLTAEQRLAAFAALKACRTAEIGVGAASVIEIERLNILHASMLAMARALRRLPTPPDMALIDGNRAPGVTCNTRCVIGGDALCLSIAAASIVAKVLRDRAMARLAVRCPGYGWEQNAGYATGYHRAALLRLGVTRHHRAAFGSVRLLQAELQLGHAAQNIVLPQEMVGEGGAGMQPGQIQKDIGEQTVQVADLLAEVVPLVGRVAAKRRDVEQAKKTIAAHQGE